MRSLWLLQLTIATALAHCSCCKLEQLRSPGKVRMRSEEFQRRRGAPALDLRAAGQLKAASRDGGQRQTRIDYLCLCLVYLS